MNQPKPKQVRQPMPYEQRMVPRMVSFNDPTAYRLLKIGEGNLSLGVRRAADLAYKEWLANREALALD